MATASEILAPKERGDFDRFEHEGAIASELSSVFADVRREAEEGRVNWRQFRTRTQEAVEEDVLKVWLLVWLWMLGGEDPLNTGVVKASQFARDRARDVASGLVDNVRQQFTGGAFPGDVLTGRRGESIAATEVTRAITHAETEARREQSERARRGDPVERDRPPISTTGPLDVGDGLLVIWRTVQDDRVCPICRPLHGEPMEEWGEQFPDGPPAHPRCRCELDYVPEE